MAMQRESKVADRLALIGGTGSTEQHTVGNNAGVSAVGVEMTAEAKKIAAQAATEIDNF